MTDKDRAEAAIDAVSRFLRLVESRDLDAASQYLAPDAEIVFPGGRRFADLQSQVESSRDRFQKVTKTFETFDVVTSGTDLVVYLTGRLSGEDASGHSFQEVRYVDRFVIKDGLITKHWVWNDLAESGVVGSGSGGRLSPEESPGS